MSLCNKHPIAYSATIKLACYGEEYEGMEYELWLYASEYRRLSGFG